MLQIEKYPRRPNGTNWFAFVDGNIYLLLIIYGTPCTILSLLHEKYTESVPCRPLNIYGKLCIMWLVLLNSCFYISLSVLFFGKLASRKNVIDINYYLKYGINFLSLRMKTDCQLFFLSWYLTVSVRKV